MDYIAKTILNDEEYLRQVSKEVDFSDKSYLEDIKLLEKYCLNNGVLAMAAVQIGIPKRIIYLKNTDLENLEDEDINEARILINPIIISRKGLTKYWEACASCLDNTGLVRRPYVIEVEYKDVDNIKQSITLEAFEATVFSHEFDHLNGILHIDKAEQVLIMNEDERKEFRIIHNYEIISKDCDFDLDDEKRRNK